MKKNCEQLAAIFNEIRTQDENASIILMVASRKQGGTFNAVSGDGITIAADLTLLMHQAPAFAPIVKMAAQAYEDGPKPPKSLLPNVLAKETDTAPDTETPEKPARRPIEINIERLIGELQINGSTAECRKEIRETVENAIRQAIEKVCADLGAQTE
ncbi:MAG: hypothetical protein LBU80_06000 [Rikenellaceae bacterium]|jgi:hypothetical protein|nr:hypothetical protein [Rikenellaceae bacterium]